MGQTPTAWKSRRRGFSGRWPLFLILWWAKTADPRLFGNPSSNRLPEARRDYWPPASGSIVFGLFGAALGDFSLQDRENGPRQQGEENKLPIGVCLPPPPFNQEESGLLLSSLPLLSSLSAN